MPMIDDERRILEWIMNGAIYLICLGKHPAKARQARTTLGKCLTQRTQKILLPAPVAAG